MPSFDKCPWSPNASCHVELFSDINVNDFHCFKSKLNIVHT